MIKFLLAWPLLGSTRESGIFGWDNEFESHTANVPAFEIDRYMVTNRQFMEFLNAGGYENHDLSGMMTTGIGGTPMSIHIRCSGMKGGDGWVYRGMFEEIPLPMDWPVYVSHAEAAAYARWAGKALPTEEQWHRAAFGSADGRERMFPWGIGTPEPEFGNFDFDRWDPAPVNAHPKGRVLSESKECWEMGGNGLPRSLGHFRDSSLFRSIVVTPQIFLMASTSS